MSFSYEEKERRVKWKRLVCSDCGNGGTSTLLYSNGQEIMCDFCAFTKRKRPSNSCNRHKDCQAAIKKARAAGKNPYIICCHDSCCEDCFGY